MKPLVYLDHHIKRDSLLYARSTVKHEEKGKLHQTLTIIHLNGGMESKRSMMRKPDFQRATNAWSPEECVDLLDAVLNERVVPSIIMWLSPESLHYVLDGGHRISVLLAWITNDWGDGPGVAAIDDLELRERARQSALEVRRLLQARKIGTYDEHRSAFTEYTQVESDGKDPHEQLGLQKTEMAIRFRRWKSIDIGFPILWVQGDYKTAEESFIKINKTGQRLSEWETKLVENRTSSAARLIMSIAQKEGSGHCWPQKDLEAKDREKVQQILKQVEQARLRLFVPAYRLPIEDSRQPLLGISPARPDLVAPYVAELLTVVAGQRGISSDTEELLKETKGEDSTAVVAEGWELIKEAIESLDNIYGPSPRSLMVMPLVYFYTEDGACIRALLYGFLHWIIDGTAKEILSRKLLLTAHRGRFEAALLQHKQELVKRISRRIGSGPEVTLQVGRYYNALLELLVQHTGPVADKSFRNAHHGIVERLNSAPTSDANTAKLPSEGSQPRAFTGRTKQQVKIRELISTFSKCAICQGYLHPGLAAQMDHIIPYSEGGETVPDNGRSVHPFCNNNRDTITKLTGGSKSIPQPEYATGSGPSKGAQLTFLSTLFEKETEPAWWAAEGVADASVAEV